MPLRTRLLAATLRVAAATMLTRSRTICQMLPDRGVAAGCIADSIGRATATLRSAVRTITPTATRKRCSAPGLPIATGVIEAACYQRVSPETISDRLPWTDV